MTVLAPIQLSLTGNPELDALLFGTAWEATPWGSAATPVIYSIAGYGSNWTGYGTGSEPYQGFVPLSTANEQQAVRAALAQWSAVSGLIIQEVADDAGGHGRYRGGGVGAGVTSNLRFDINLEPTGGSFSLPPFQDKPSSGPIPVARHSFLY